MRRLFPPSFGFGGVGATSAFGFQRKGKTIDVENRGYRLYVRFWDAIYPLRDLRFRSRRLAVGVARELGVLPAIKKLLRKET